MDSLIRSVEEALETQDYNALSRIFTSDWNAVGQGEQRTLAAYAIHAVVVTKGPAWCKAALQSNADVLLPVFTTMLSHLPTTVEAAADNTLRQVLFQFLTQEADGECHHHHATTTSTVEFIHTYIHAYIHASWVVCMHVCIIKFN